MNIIIYLFKRYFGLFVPLLLIGLLSAYLDSLAIGGIFNGFSLNVAIYIALASVLRILFVWIQSYLGAKVTSDMGSRTIILFKNRKITSEELSSGLLLKSINFNNYAVRPILSILINGFTCIILVLPVLGLLKIDPLIYIPSFCFVVVGAFFVQKYFFKSVSGEFSKLQDRSGADLQKVIRDSSDTVELDSTYRRLQIKTANIYFWSNTPRSWIELLIVLIAGLIFLFSKDLSVSSNVMAGFGYSFYRIMTPANSILQAYVSLRSYSQSSEDALHFMLNDKGYEK